MIDIKVTPNRADCLGVRGIARDLAAAGLGTLKPLDTPPVAGTLSQPDHVDASATSDARQPCPLFVGRHFRGLRNGPRPTGCSAG